MSPTVPTSPRGPKLRDESGLPRALTVAALAWGGMYLLWRTTTLGGGRLLVVSVPLLLTELWALTQLGLLAVQCWRVPATAPAPAPAPPGTVPRSDVAITAAGATLDAIERSLVGTDGLVGVGRITIVDAADRPEVRAMADRFHVRYVIDPTVGDNGARAAHANTSSSLYLWIEAGQVAMPSLLRSLIERFDESDVAICQCAIGLLNADSLVHLRGGRDEAALEREVVGPGLDRLGVAPWHGPGAMVRRAAIDAVDGYGLDDHAAVPRAVTRLHRTGWRTTYDARQLVRAVAPDSLDDYLERRRRRVSDGLRVFGTPESPLRGRDGGWRQRLIHLATALSFGTGLRQLLQVGVIATCLLWGQVPFSVPVGQMVAMWLPATALAIGARRALARGSMATGDWIRHGWRTVGADAAGLWARVRPRGDERTPTHHKGASALARLRLLTTATVLVELALVARALTMFDGDLLPAMTTTERVVLMVGGLALLVPMVDVLQVIVLRRQRRRHHRLQVELPIAIGDANTTTVDLAPTGVGLTLDAAPPVGAETTFTLVLPSTDGPHQEVQGTAVVRSAEPDATGRVRVGLEFQNLADPARLALIAYCAIGHGTADDAPDPALAAPDDLQVQRMDRHQRALQALTATAAVAGVTLVLLGPAASAALATDVVAIDQVCATTAAGDALPGAIVETRTADGWTPLGATGTDGCVAVAAGTDPDEVSLAYAGGRATSEDAEVTGGILLFVLHDHRVVVLDTDGAPVTDAGVRYYADAWYDVQVDASGRGRIDALVAPANIEVTWRGARLVETFSPDLVIRLSLVSADPGADIVEIDGGDGWEPFSDPMMVLPGRFLVRLADGTTHKFEVPAGHELTVPSGTLAQLVSNAETAAPAPTATATPEVSVEPAPIEAEATPGADPAEPEGTPAEPEVTPESSPEPSPTEATPDPSPPEPDTTPEPTPTEIEATPEPVPSDAEATPQPTGAPTLPPIEESAP